ncbi:TPA: hypothetical protein DEP96_03465 [Candidatus Uhrbacteria bacterium]|nr:hypothetical protein [Candidatus Uhrbacteria bacterium]
MNKKDLVDISTIVNKSIRDAIQETVPNMIKTAIQETVPNMIKSAIQETVPQMIKSAIQETVPGMIKETVKDLLEQNNHILKLELRDEMYAMNKAMENRLVKKIEDTRTEIITDIGEILDQAILPQIGNHEHRLFKIENQLATC